MLDAVIETSDDVEARKSDKFTLKTFVKSLNMSKCANGPSGLLIFATHADGGSEKIVKTHHRGRQKGARTAPLGKSTSREPGHWGGVRGGGSG